MKPSVCFVLAAILLFPPLPKAAAASDVAIVVHAGVPVDDLTFAEVRKVLLGDRQYWAPNLRVTLLIRLPWRGSGMLS